jgi:transcriptional regulator with XRE-family HTH domain
MLACDTVMVRGGPIEARAAPAGFGALLRQHRLAMGLTQGSLAKQARLSVHGIQKLESGATHPHRDTAERLIRALQLSGPDEASVKLAARPVPRRRQPDPTSGGKAPQASAQRHPPSTGVDTLDRAPTGDRRDRALDRQFAVGHTDRGRRMRQDATRPGSRCQVGPPISLTVSASSTWHR